MPEPRSIVLACLAALLLEVLPGGASAQVSARASAPAARPSLTVTTDSVRRETIPVIVSATGLVTAWQEAGVGSSAGGLELKAITVEEGEPVEAGEVLARLDDALLQAQFGQQQAAVASAEATYAAALSSNERGRRLAGSGNLSPEVTEERETTVKTAAAALGQARAALRTLQVQLDRTVIRAPFAGVVSAKPAILGITVQAGTEIVRLQRDGALRAAVDVPEQYLSRIARGDPADVTGPNGATIAAKVALIGAAVDPATHLGRVEIALPPRSSLKAGMFVRAAIATGGTEAMTVAESALTWRDGRTGVFVVAGDNSVTLKPVEAGERRDGRVAVAGSLAEGERVVATGAGFLSDGNTVRVVSEEASTAAGAPDALR